MGVEARVGAKARARARVRVRVRARVRVRVEVRARVGWAWSACARLLELGGGESVELRLQRREVFHIVLCFGVGGDERGAQALEGLVVGRADDLEHFHDLDNLYAIELVEDLAEVNRLAVPELQSNERSRVRVGGEDRLGVAAERACEGGDEGENESEGECGSEGEGEGEGCG